MLGIDPGISGALVAIDGSGRVVRQTVTLTRREGKGRSIVDALAVREWLEELPRVPDLTVIERVGARPGQGVVSMFNFGFSTGILVGLVESRAWPYEQPTPQSWKAVVLEGTAKDKAAAIDYCKRRFPNLNLTPGRTVREHDGLADAACLAEWGRRLLGKDK